MIRKFKHPYLDNYIVYIERKHYQQYKEFLQYNEEARKYQQILVGINRDYINNKADMIYGELNNKVDQNYLDLFCRREFAWLHKIIRMDSEEVTP